MPVTWSSSNTGVAHIDDNGNLVALSLGTTVIRATTKSNSMNGSPVTDSVTLTVDKDVSDYLNIHPRIWQQLGIYNEAAASSGSTLAFAAEAPPGVGKTFALLVPALREAAGERRKIGRAHV